MDKGEIHSWQSSNQSTLMPRSALAATVRSMFARVTIPPHASMGAHKHEGNTETYHILSGRARYNDNSKEIEIGAGTTTFCADGEVHAIANASETEDLVFMALIINK